MLPIGFPIGIGGDDPIGGGGGIIFVCGMDFKKLLKPPLLSAVVVKLTCGGCGGTGGVPIFPPIGPLTMLNLRKKLVYAKILYD
tara:strand:+ start:283 stop:534 length:252 start_codon:yes stop_codon:yes gene_type:complete